MGLFAIGLFRIRSPIRHAIGLIVTIGHAYLTIFFKLKVFRYLFN